MMTATAIKGMPMAWYEHEKLMDELKDLERTNRASVTMFCNAIRGHIETTSSDIRQLLSAAARNADPKNDWIGFVDYLAWNFQTKDYRNHIALKHNDTLHHHCLNLIEIKRLILNA